MIRKNGNRFSRAADASVCAKTTLKQGDMIMIRFNRTMI